MNSTNLTAYARLIYDPKFFGDGDNRVALVTVALNSWGKFKDKKKAIFVQVRLNLKRYAWAEGLKKGDEILFSGCLELEEYRGKMIHTVDWPNTAERIKVVRGNEAAPPPTPDPDPTNMAGFDDPLDDLPF